MIVPVRSGKPLGTESTVDPIVMEVSGQPGSVSDWASELPDKTKTGAMALEKIMLTWIVKNSVSLVGRGSSEVRMQQTRLRRVCRGRGQYFGHISNW